MPLRRISPRLLIVILCVVIASAVGIIYQFTRATEGLEIRLMLIHGRNPQKVTIELKSTGNKPAQIYKIIGMPWGINYTFSEDIIVPPGTSVRITFPVLGGRVILETLLGEDATGGGIAIMEGGQQLFNQTLVDMGILPELGVMPATGYAVPIILTRDGNTFRHTLQMTSEEYIPG